MNTTRKHIERISIASLLIAFTIIFTRFVGVDFGFSRISLGAVPVMMASIILGPIYGAVVGVGADIIGNGFRYGFGSTLPWPIISALINGVLPWLLFKAMRKLKSNEQKVPFIIYFFVLIWLLISLIIWINPSIAIPLGKDSEGNALTHVITFNLTWKIVFPLGLGLVLVMFYFVTHFINKYFKTQVFQNKDCPTPYEVALFVFITSFIVQVIWGPIWKGFLFAGFSPYGYLPILALESLIFLIIFPFKTFFVSFLLSLYYRYIDKTNLETKTEPNINA